MSARSGRDTGRRDVAGDDEPRQTVELGLEGVTPAGRALCRKGGRVDLTDTDGVARNQGQCVSWTDHDL